MSSAASWMRMTMPPVVDAIRPVQQVAATLAEQCGFDAIHRNRMEVCIEEIIKGILHYSFDDGAITDGELVIEFKVEPPFFHIHLLDYGLPIDLAMLPIFEGESRPADELDAGGLAARLIRHFADGSRVVSQGKDGTVFELFWFLPSDPVATTPDKQAATDVKAPTPPPEPVDSICMLDESHAIQIARLVCRGYGYSYVYSDIYYPDRVRAYNKSGLLASWGALTASGILVGHLALMKEDARSRALEWGVAVVDPRWRGLGIMEDLLRQAMAHAEQRDEEIICAHAVTAHPYTQKTCCRFGFEPLALLLGYAPATMQIKGINEHLIQRESTFLCVRRTHPLPEQKLYLPPQYSAVLKRLLAALNSALPEACLHEGDDQADVGGIRTEYTVSIAPCVNVGRIQFRAVGADCGEVLDREIRRFYRERIDVVYLTMDLADPGAARLVREAEARGYFLSGLTPMMSPAYGFTLQLPCAFDVDYSAIQTHGELAEWLKEEVQISHSRRKVM